jgi:hypothetical protein
MFIYVVPSCHTYFGIDFIEGEGGGMEGAWEDYLEMKQNMSGFGHNNRIEKLVSLFLNKPCKKLSYLNPRI